MNILEITVGDTGSSLEKWAMTLDSALKGDEVTPHFGIGFETMSQFGAIFTPKRWELIEGLKIAGPLTIYALAKQLNRHYRNVHCDITALTEWLVIEKNDDNKVYVPWDEIDVRWPLLKRAA